MTVINRALLFICVLSLFGCAASSKGKGNYFSLENAESEFATIYHYRVSEFMGGGRIHLVLSNDKPMVEIGNGGYYKQTVTSGRYVFRSKIEVRTGIFVFAGNFIMNSLKDFDDRAVLNVEHGKKYFVKWQQTDASIVTESQAVSEMEGLKEFTSQLN